MIRRYEQGAYEDLQRKLALWYDDLSLCRMDGVSAMRNYKLSARLYRLMKRQDNDKEPYKRAAKELAGIVPAVSVSYTHLAIPIWQNSWRNTRRRKSSSSIAWIAW